MPTSSPVTAGRNVGLVLVAPGGDRRAHRAVGGPDGRGRRDAPSSSASPGARRAGRRASAGGGRLTGGGDAWQGAPAARRLTCVTLRPVGDATRHAPHVDPAGILAGGCRAHRGRGVPAGAPLHATAEAGGDAGAHRADTIRNSLPPTVRGRRDPRGPGCKLGRWARRYLAAPGVGVEVLERARLDTARVDERFDPSAFSRITRPKR